MASAPRLTTAFRAGPPKPGDDSLEVQLEQALVRLRVAWPSLSIADEAFAAWLGRKAGDGPPSLSALHLEDLGLAFACAQRSPGAAEALEHGYLRPLAAELTRTRNAPAEVDEAMQRLRERLLVGGDRGPLIAQYEGRGPLAGWVRVAAMRALLNVRRAEGHAPPAVEPLSLPLVSEVSPELALLKARDRAVLEQALREALAALTANERNLLRLHFVDGLGLDRLAPLFSVHRATAARWLAAARGRLREEVLQRICGQLKLSPAELRSWVGLIRSALGVSVRQLIDAPDRGSTP